MSSARLTRILRSAAFRLTLIYAGLFVVSAGVLFATVFVIATAALQSDMQAVLRTEAFQLADIHRRYGLLALAEQVTRRMSFRTRGPIYYLVQARVPAGETGAVDGSHAKRWLRESWPTVRLGLLTSLIGFAALVFAGFPGLAQLGVFSLAGLLAAAATTRWVFPVIAPDGAPGTGLREPLGRLMQRAAGRLRRVRYGVVALAAFAALALVVLPSPWRGTLSDLSPIDAADLARDAALRADVGAPDAGTLVAVSAPDEAGVLAAAEAVGARLDPLVNDGFLQGYASPARFLPSPATQRARLAALPDAATLSTRLATAAEGGPLPAERLAGFIEDVQTARKDAPFDRKALENTPLASAVDALLLPGDATRPWRALLSLQAVPDLPLDADRVRAAIAGVPGAQLVSVRPALDALYARYLQRAAWQAAFGAAAVVALLALTLKRLRRLAEVLLPIAAATVVVLAALAASGAALGILHLVGLLLTVAIGSNYALFFDHLRRAAEADVDTLASLLLANLTTVISFGLLASSQIPVLQAVGIVVAPGALLCLVFSASCLGRREGGAGAHGKIAA